MTYQILVAALLPIVILLIYIYYKDKRSSEPISQIIKAFLYGVLSVFVSLCISTPFKAIGLYTSEPTTISEAFSISFYGAAIPEEAAKLFMLWLLLKKSRHFDEWFDGIVYAVFVSLGFAGLENIMYLFDNSDSFISVGVLRGLMSVPMHFAFGVLMGYFYSLAKFGNKFKMLNYILAFVAPVVAHGIYDSLVFTAGVLNDIWGTLLFIGTIAFCIYLWKVCRRKIEEHKSKDTDEPITATENSEPDCAYTPQPLDCSTTPLPQELDSLFEDLSKNVHEVWAQGRIAEGWSYGPQRDDVNKKHPCLVPYEQLPEEEKGYDRRTAEGTLKFIIKKGYRIIKDEEQAN